MNFFTGILVFVFILMWIYIVRLFVKTTMRKNTSRTTDKNNTSRKSASSTQADRGYQPDKNSAPSWINELYVPEGDRLNKDLQKQNRYTKYLEQGSNNAASEPSMTTIHIAEVNPLNRDASIEMNLLPCSKGDLNHDENDGLNIINENEHPQKEDELYDRAN